MKHISNYTLTEFREMFKTIPYDIVEIVYNYYHRDKSYTVEEFALKNHISVATLYRYKNRVEMLFKKRRRLS